MKPALSDLYQEELLAYADAVKQFSRLQNPTGTGTAVSRSCGSRVTAKRLWQNRLQRQSVGGVLSFLVKNTPLQGLICTAKPLSGNTIKWVQATCFTLPLRDNYESQLQYCAWQVSVQCLCSLNPRSSFP